MSKARTSSSFTLVKQLIGAQAVPLLLLLIINIALNIQVEDATLALGPSDETMRWMLQLGLGVWELVMGVIFFLILSAGVVKAIPLQGKHLLSKPMQPGFFGSFIAEYLRMLAQVLLWAIALILPAFWRYAQLLFVPYIAIFSSAYQRDEVDALELSKELTRKRFKLVLGVFLGTTALQLLFEFAPHFNSGLHTVPMRAVFMSVSFLISIWTYSFMFGLFKEALEG